MGVTGGHFTGAAGAAYGHSRRSTPPRLAPAGGRISPDRTSHVPLPRFPRRPPPGAVTSHCELATYPTGIASRAAGYPPPLHRPAASERPAYRRIDPCSTAPSVIRPRAETEGSRVASYPAHPGARFGRICPNPFLGVAFSIVFILGARFALNRANVTGHELEPDMP